MVWGTFWGQNVHFELGGPILDAHAGSKATKRAKRTARGPDSALSEGFKQIGQQVRQNRYAQLVTCHILGAQFGPNLEGVTAT